MDQIAEFVEEPPTGTLLPVNIEYVYFDLETTGFYSNHTEILQIAAKANLKEFQAFIKPVYGIPRKVSEITHLFLYDDAMFYEDLLSSMKQVETISLREALTEFLVFLRSFGKPVILIAHNGFRFDVPFLIRDIKEINLWAEFKEIVCGFVDTYRLLQKKLPERKAQKAKFNQSDLACDLLGPEAATGAHNALNDVKILQKIVNKVNITDAELRAHSKSIPSMIFDLEMPTRKESLECLQEYLSESMRAKIAKAGFSLHDLQNVFNEKGEEGIELLLSEDVGGRPRVTKSKKIITNAIVAVKESLAAE